MRKAVLIALLLTSVLPAYALASLVDPSLIPDGEYTVDVERVVNAKQIVVKMDNGVEAQIPATGSMSFAIGPHVKKLKIFVYKGVVITYKPA